MSYFCIIICRVIQQNVNVFLFSVDADGVCSTTAQTMMLFISVDAPIALLIHSAVVIFLGVGGSWNTFHHLSQTTGRLMKAVFYFF